MELYIGENIKRLRKQKGITQETLADHMHVSIAAVSKWERNETYPDISMVIPLATYFEVSTDEILGLDAAKNEEKIKQYLDKARHLSSIGKAFECFDLVSKAYGEFPNDWRIVELYLWQLNYDPNCTDPYGDEVHKEELYNLCERVLDECTIDQTRYTALSIIGGLYVLDGEKEKAIKTAKRFPNYWMTAGEELEGCYSRDCNGNNDWFMQLRENIYNITDLFQTKIRSAILETNEIDNHEQIRQLKKVITLLNLVFDDGDYGFYYYDLSHLHIWIANRYVWINDLDNAIENYKLAFNFAKAFDNLPKITVHTSFLVKGKIFDMAQTNSNTEENLVAYHISRLNSWDFYNKIKENPKMEAIIAEFTPFAGNKKDYL